jgi:hypothetical protein
MHPAASPRSLKHDFNLRPRYDFYTHHGYHWHDHLPNIGQRKINAQRLENVANSTKERKMKKVDENQEEKWRPGRDSNPGPTGDSREYWTGLYYLGFLTMSA